MDLREYKKILRRRRKEILFFFLATQAFYFISLLRLPKAYIAVSKIAIRTRSLEERLFSSLTGIGAGTVSLTAQLEEMRSADFARMVAKSLRKVSPRLTPGAVAQALSLSADEKTEIVTIAARTKDPQLSTVLANRAARLAVKRNRDLAQQDLESAQSFLKKKQQEYARKLQTAEQKLALFNQKFGTIEYGTELERRLDKLVSLRVREENLKSASLQAQTEIAKLSSQLQKESPTIDFQAVVQNPLLQEFQQSLRPLKLQLSEALSQYTPQHPKVKAIEAKMERLRGEFLEEAKERGIPPLKKKTRGFPLPKFILAPQREINPLYTSLVDLILQKKLFLIGAHVEQELMRAQVPQEEEKLAELASGKPEYARLLTDRETLLRLARTVEENLTEMGIYQAMRLGNARVLETASHAILLPRARPAAYLLSLLLSLLGSLVLAVVLENLDTRVRSAYQVRRFTRLTVLGALPREKEAPPLLHQLPGKSPLSEIYASIAFRLEHLCAKTSAKAITITSSVPGEGKTLVCANLAFALSRLGLHVVCCDLDFRRPRLHRTFSIPDLSPGASELLSGELPLTEESLERALRALPEEVDFLPCGYLVPNPAALLRKKSLEELLGKLREKYDFCLLDTPPVNIVIDPIVIAQRADGSLLVHNASATHRQDLLSAKTALQEAQAPLLGVVINRAEEPAESYYRYYYYSRSHKRKD